MAMSKDRILFEIPWKMLYNGKLNKLLDSVFQISPENAQACYTVQKNMQITCRPSQFGRFVVLRNAAGLKNNFKDLNTELIQVKQEREPIQTKFDVSLNENKATTSRY